jgi:hypothetical protein
LKGETQNKNHKTKKIKMKKNSIILHSTMLEVLKELNKEDIINYIENVFKCNNDEAPIFNNTTMKLLYTSILPVIEADKLRYDKKVINGKLNGLKGGAPLGNNNASKQPKTT